MSRFAENTTVPTERSRAEIEATLARYGADQFMYGWDASEAVIRFRANGRYVQFRLVMPDRTDIEFTQHSRGSRSPEQAEKLWEQSGRQRWRALALVVKAKLEAVASGISTFEDEFLAQTMLPDGSTVGEMIAPEIEAVYSDGKMPRALLALPAGAV